MSFGDWFIPEGKLQKNLIDLIPGEDTIIYTSAANVQLKDDVLGNILKVGELAITNRGIAFFAKRKGLKGGVLAFRGGPIKEYIGYDRIARIEGKGDHLILHVTPDIDAPEEQEQWYELTVIQSEPHEGKETFVRRRKSFSAVVEQAMYRYRSGQAKPEIRRKVRHPAKKFSMTLKKGQIRRVQYCPKCGAFLEDPATFCESCGEPLRQK
ncbi:MAG: zinc ribbon domain-containing protein [Candidatus Hodarchaeota archaeon]